MVSDWEPLESGDRKVRGAPVFLVAGRTENGRQSLKLFPIAITEIHSIELSNGKKISGEIFKQDKEALHVREGNGKEHRIEHANIAEVQLYNQFRRLGIPPPAELAKKVEAMKELSDDFLAPFFEGYKAGGADPKDRFLTS